MAIRLLSVAAVAVGLALSILLYVMAPMARAVGCAASEGCEAMEFPQRLIQSMLPLGISVALVAVALAVYRKHQALGRAVIALPLMLIAVWACGLFVAAFFGQ
jgi:hypothetical protein